MRHVEPFYTRIHAHRIDVALERAMEQLTYLGCLGDELIRRRFHMAGRYRGCGIRSRVEVAPIAYVASFIESAERMIDRASTRGAVRDISGFFPSLEPSLGRGSFDPDGHRFEEFISGSTGLALELSETWDELRSFTTGETSSGPLESTIDGAGAGTSTHLQRQITEQIERVRRDQLHRDMMRLPIVDPRRVAWASVDIQSSQWVSSWPTHDFEISDQEMPEVISTYLGCESPVVRALAGRPIPCGRRGGDRVCDPHGFQIGLATLPGTDHTDCHDAIGRELFDICTESHLRIELQPKSLFTTLIPIAVLLAPGRPPSIVPDASIDVALPPVVTTRGRRRRGRVGAHRRHLFDIKTIHGGTNHYYSAHARDEQSGAVRHRESQVWPNYLHHARALDRQYSPAGTTPIEDRLRSHTETRGLVFGAYGEASTDVHTLLRIAADAQAEQQWQLAGARSATEMRAFLIGRLRRRMGLVTVRAMARHRLARVPFIGVPRQMVVARRQRGGAVAPYAPAIDHFAFFAFQAGGHAAPAVA